MNTSRPVSCAAFSSLIAILALTGCGGAMTSFPDSVVTPQVQGPPMRGMALGGHSPIVGMHIYLLQPGLGGYGSPAISLLGNNGAASASGYAITPNPATGGDPNVPAGAQFVTTDSTGSVSFTGGYACTAGQPVFSYGTGGSTPNTQPPTTQKQVFGPEVTVGISSIDVATSGSTADNPAGTASYAVTLTGNEQLTGGETVTLNGLTGNLAFLNGTVQTVLDSPTPTKNAFSFNATDVYGTYQFITNRGQEQDPQTYSDNLLSGTYTTTGGPNPAGADGGGNDNDNAIKDPDEKNDFTFNPTGGGASTGTAAIGTGGTSEGAPVSQAPTSSPIVELATLGVCPDTNITPVGTGNFSTGSTALTFVYMNEVSTVATAYTFQPFTSSANNNAWDIGSSGSMQALAAINVAAETAAQLYAIQGNSLLISSSDDGEGHIANAKTPTVNNVVGAVPQTTIDSLANVLAACLDSTPALGGVLSSQCSALFSTATDNGQTDGVAPTDIATAAINIARFPAGNNSNGNADPTFVSDIFGTPSSIVPYDPALTKVPNDWTLAITYTGGSIGVANALSPHNIAVDFSGNIYHANFDNNNNFTVLSPLGVPATLTALTPNALNGPTSIALDTDTKGVSANVWLADEGPNQNGTTVTRCPIAGGTCVVTQVGSTLTGTQDAEIDASGNIWATVGAGGPNGANGGLVEISSAATPTVLLRLTNQLDEPTGMSIAAGTNGLIWTGDTASASDISDCTATADCTELGNTRNNGNVNVGTNTENTAIDSSGDIWVAGNDTVAAIKSGSFASLGGSPIDTGLNNINDGMAIDGNNTVWVVNNGSDTVLAFSATNSGTTPVGTVLEISPAQGYKSSTGLAPEGIAIDPSGNVWYDTTGTGAIVELVGAAAPTVTPLSFAVAKTMLGTKP
jgi:hypothetical protein